MPDEKDTSIVKVEPSAIDLSVKTTETAPVVPAVVCPAIGQVELTKAQTDILYAPVDDEAVEIRPDGLIYLPWMEYVSRLRDALGMGWVIEPDGQPKMGPNKASILWGFRLYVKGIYAGYAVGEQKYSLNNATMNWSDACEGAKSNALMRLCKGVGIGLELWRPSFIRNWKAKYAEKYREGGRELWRKKGGEVVATPSLAEPMAGEHYETADPEQNDSFFKVDNAVKVDTSSKTGQGSFFTDEDIQAEEKAVKQAISTSADRIAKDAPIVDDAERDAIINAIKGSLKAERIDNTEFKAWLDIYQMTIRPPRHFVGKQFNNLSFHVGSGPDLKFLYSKITEAIKKFRHYKKSLEVA